MMDTSMDTTQSNVNGDRPRDPGPPQDSEMKRVLWAGLIGAAVASVGYLVYNRLDENQKETIRSTVMGFVEDKVAEIRSQLKI